MAKSSIRIEFGKVVDMAMTQVLDDTTINDISIREWIDKITSGVYKPVRHTTNVSKIADCDEFICNDCGLHLKNWVRVEITDEYGEDHYEYEFEFCPSCGAKIIKE